MLDHQKVDETLLVADRRRWLVRAGMGLGSVALADLLSHEKASGTEGVPSHGVIHPTHHRPTAKRVIYL
ncbi:MAG: sulfatase, partial [Pirellula sp.]